MHHHVNASRLISNKTKGEFNLSVKEERQYGWCPQSFLFNIKYSLALLTKYIVYNYFINKSAKILYIRNLIIN